MLNRALPVLTVAVGTVVLFLAGLALGGVGADPVKLSVKLDTKQEVPRPKGAPGGTGLLTATLSGRTLDWRLTFARLTGPATAAHVHLGSRGVAGGVAAPLCGPCVSGRRGTTRLSAKAAAALRRGETYVNVHTKKNPAGEIRGQIPGERQPPATTGSTPTLTLTMPTETDPYP